MKGRQVKGEEEKTEADKKGADRVPRVLYIGEEERELISRLI